MRYVLILSILFLGACNSGTDWSTELTGRWESTSPVTINTTTDIPTPTHYDRTVIHYISFEFSEWGYIDDVGVAEGDISVEVNGDHVTILLFHKDNPGTAIGQFDATFNRGPSLVGSFWTDRMIPGSDYLEIRNDQRVAFVPVPWSIR